MRLPAESLRKFAAVTIAVGLPTFAGCSKGGSEWRRTRVPASIADSIQGHRLVSRVGAVDTLIAVAQFTLPDSVHKLYRFSFPYTLAVGTSPNAWLAIGDMSDRAVHVFRADNTYAFSFFGGSRRDPAFRGGSLTAVAPLGTSGFMASISNGVVVSFDSQGRRVGVDTRIPTIRGSAPEAGHRVLLGPDSLWYDNWFADHQPVIRREEWRKSDGLVRVFDQRGHLIRVIGRPIQYPGASLTHLLNRGEIQIFADTLWFARRADARILAFPLTGPFDSPARTIELPVYYRAEAPVEYVETTGTEAIATRIQEHLRAFAMSADGDFYVLQSVGWPQITAKNIAWVPRSLVVVLSRDGVVKRRLYSATRLVALEPTERGLVGVAVDGARPRT